MNKLTLEEMLQLDEIMYIKTSNSDVLYSYKSNGKYFVDLINLNDYKIENIIKDHINDIQLISIINSDNAFLFESEINSKEETGIFLYKENEIIQLTSHYNSKFLGWAEANKSFYFLSNHRDTKYMDVYKLNLNNLSTTLIYKNLEGYQINYISKDGTLLVLNKYNKKNYKLNTFLYLNREKKLKKLDFDNIKPAFLDYNHRYLYYYTNKEHDFTYIRRLCLDNLHSDPIISEDWDVVYINESPTGAYLLYIINHNGNYRLNIFCTISGQVLNTSSIPEGTIKSFDITPSEDAILLVLETSNSPSNVYLFDLFRNNCVKLTNNFPLSYKYKKDIFVEGIRKEYKDNDRGNIYGILYKPQNTKNNEFPLVIWVHGGPGGQSILNFNVFIQFLCMNGYSVFAINHKGSQGYGKNYIENINMKHGIEDLKDCISVKEYLSKEENVNVNKSSIIGVSYGAYLSLSAITFYPKAFKSAVCLFGIYNWLSTLNNLPLFWEAHKPKLYKKIGHPLKDTEHLVKISPYFHLKNIEKPTLFIDGGNDIRGNVEEVKEIQQVLLNKGLPSKYISYSDEGHGLSKKENIADSYIKIVEFLNSHVK